MISLACTLLLASCNQDAKNAGTQGTSLTVNSLEPLTYTIYTENVELFVEFRPLIIGEKIKFAAHYTLLGETFKPLENGSLTVSLLSGSNGIKATADSLSSPGIFQLSLQPKYQDTSTLVFELKTKDFSDRIVIRDLPIYESIVQASKAGGAHAHASDIIYLKEQSWNTEFATVEVKQQNFNGVIRTSGQFINAPSDEYVITATSSGILRLSFPALVGSQVNAGQQLFTVSSNDLTQNNLNSQIAAARNSANNAKKNYDRAKLAIQDKLISENDFQKSKLDYENAQTLYNQLSNNQSGSGKGISAGKSGYIKSLLVSDGAYVQEGTPLAIITNSKNVILQANLYQSDLVKAKEIVGANFKIAGEDKVYSTSELAGRVISIGKVVADKAPFVPVLIQINNVGNIYPGAFADVYLITSSQSPSTVIPKTALIEEQGNYYVYIQLTGESFEKRKVVLGESDGKQVSVTAGIQNGERVVSKGGYQIKLMTASGAMPAHGHEH